MTGAAVISEILSDWDNVTPLDADNAGRRAKLFNELQRVFGDVWNDRPWPFRIRTLLSQFLTNVNTIDVPADFMESGPYGGLYLSIANGGTGEKLDYVSPYELLRIRETGGGSTSSPGIYSIFGVNPATFRQQFQFPLNPSSYAVDIFYYAIPPTLSDASVGSNLEFIPAEWHEPVIMMGMIAATLEKKGDAQADKYTARYERALARMRARAMPGKDTTQQLPSFFSR